MTSGVYERTERTRGLMSIAKKNQWEDAEYRKRVCSSMSSAAKRRCEAQIAILFKKYRSNPINLSKDAFAFLNGELLGDGHLHEFSFVASYCHTSKYRQYLEWLQDKLASFGIIQAGEINGYSYNTFKDKRYKDTTYTSFRYHSKGYLELKELRSVWYPSPEFVKRVPSDIRLAPITLRQWYIGDGYNGAPEGNGILFFVPSFPIGDKELLINKLSELGFCPNFQGNQTRIHIGMRHVDEFLDYIGPCSVECYNYKWDGYNYKYR